MSITTCKECEVVVDGHEVYDAELEEYCCPYCGEPVTTVAEYDPRRER